MCMHTFMYHLFERRFGLLQLKKNVYVHIYMHTYIRTHIHTPSSHMWSNSGKMRNLLLARQRCGKRRISIQSSCEHDEVHRRTFGASNAVSA